MGIIIILQGPDAGRHFSLKDGRATFGRNTDCSISLTGKQISRHHARIFQQDGHFFLEDLGSSNGTYINNVRLIAHVPSPLSERDSFQIGVAYLLGLRARSAAAA